LPETVAKILIPGLAITVKIQDMFNVIVQKVDHRFATGVMKLVILQESVINQTQVTGVLVLLG